MPAQESLSLSPSFCRVEPGSGCVSMSNAVSSGSLERSRAQRRAGVAGRILR